MVCRMMTDDDEFCEFFDEFSSLLSSNTLFFGVRGENDEDDDDDEDFDDKKGEVGVGE